MRRNKRNKRHKCLVLQERKDIKQMVKSRKLKTKEGDIIVFVNTKYGFTTSLAKIQYFDREYVFINVLNGPYKDTEGTIKKDNIIKVVTNKYPEYLI